MDVQEEGQREEAGENVTLRSLIVLLCQMFLGDDNR
jgi:hypothetical protein